MNLLNLWKKQSVLSRIRGRIILDSLLRIFLETLSLISPRDFPSFSHIDSSFGSLNLLNIYNKQSVLSGIRWRISLDSLLRIILETLSLISHPGFPSFPHIYSSFRSLYVLNLRNEQSVLTGIPCRIILNSLLRIFQESLSLLSNRDFSSFPHIDSSFGSLNLTNL